jgi:hypothetical protein
VVILGIKLNSDLNPLECSIEDGFIKVYLFDEVIKLLETSIPKNIVMNKQCNFFHSNLGYLLGYLVSDKYKILIRKTGNLDILSLNNILLKRVTIDISSIADDSIKIRSCGSLFILDRVHPAYIADLYNNKSIIFSSNIPASLIIDLKDETNNFIHRWSKSNFNDVGSLHIKDNGDISKGLYLNKGSGIDYMLENYQLIKQDGIIGGVA